jgi:hypothetical protein
MEYKCTKKALVITAMRQLTLPDSQCLSLTSGYLWILKRDCINYVVESKWKVRAALITKI